jgi:hypothetical protein
MSNNVGSKMKEKVKHKEEEKKMGEGTSRLEGKA